MAGCKSCSGCSPEPSPQVTKKAEKLEKGERSGNPRYPLIFVGKQAIYTDDSAQMIVTVVSDNSDDACDCFSLKPQRILKDARERHKLDEPFEATQPASENCWKLRALI
ncbi:MAG: hypothetical protein HY913_20670 [Desulfomonile tiedjei]|nr:hypothetical protein [Desulfomonile tiedjei]